MDATTNMGWTNGGAVYADGCKAVGVVFLYEEEVDGKIVCSRWMGEITTGQHAGMSKGFAFRDDARKFVEAVIAHPSTQDVPEAEVSPYREMQREIIAAICKFLDQWTEDIERHGVDNKF